MACARGPGQRRWALDGAHPSCTRSTATASARALGRRPVQGPRLREGRPSGHRLGRGRGQPRGEGARRDPERRSPPRPRDHGMPRHWIGPGAPRPSARVAAGILRVLDAADARSVRRTRDTVVGADPLALCATPGRSWIRTAPHRHVPRGPARGPSPREWHHEGVDRHHEMRPGRREGHHIRGWGPAPCTSRAPTATASARRVRRRRRGCTGRSSMPRRRPRPSHRVPHWRPRAARAGGAPFPTAAASRAGRGGCRPVRGRTLARGPPGPSFPS